MIMRGLAVVDSWRLELRAFSKQLPFLSFSPHLTNLDGGLAPLATSPSLVEAWFCHFHSEKMHSPRHQKYRRLLFVQGLTVDLPFLETR